MLKTAVPRLYWKLHQESRCLPGTEQRQTLANSLYDDTTRTMMRVHTGKWCRDLRIHLFSRREVVYPLIKLPASLLYPKPFRVSALQRRARREIRWLFSCFAERAQSVAPNPLRNEFHKFPNLLPIHMLSSNSKPAIVLYKVRSIWLSIDGSKSE